VNRHQSIVIHGGIKGAAYSSAVIIPLSFVLNRTWRYYRSLPLPLKVLGVVTLVVPATVVKAETEGNAWERSKWKDIGKQEIDDLEERERRRWEALTPKQKALDWASRRRSVILMGIRVS
jgi:hypothetical protein